MIKIPKTPALCFFLGIYSTFSCLAKQPLDAYKRVDSAVVCIESHRADASTTILGSGFFVAPGIIITTFHQTRSIRKLLVYVSESDSVEGQVLYSDPKKDISLIKIKAPDSPHLTIKPVEPELGDAVFTIGCPLGLSHSLTRGVISFPRRNIKGRILLQTDLSVNLGNSGGPLVNDSGQILGMIYGMSTNAKEGINFAVPVDDLLSVMAANRLEILRSLNANSHLKALWSQAQNSTDAKTRLDLYKAITEEAPWLVEAYFNRGIVFHELQEYAQAVDEYNRAIHKSPKYYQALSNRGLAYYKMGKYSKARDSLLKAISINSNYSPAFLNLGIVYDQGLSDKTSAEHAYRQFLRLDPAPEEARIVQHWFEENGIEEN